MTREALLRSPPGHSQNADVGATPKAVISLRPMGWFKRRRDLDLRPLAELHDEFANRPGAEALLAESEEELAQREGTDTAYAKPRSADA